MFCLVSGPTFWRCVLPLRLKMSVSVEEEDRSESPPSVCPSMKTNLQTSVMNLKTQCKRAMLTHRCDSFIDLCWRSHWNIDHCKETFWHREIKIYKSCNQSWLLQFLDSSSTTAAALWAFNSDSCSMDKNVLMFHSSEQEREVRVSSVHLSVWLVQRWKPNLQ